MRDLYCHIAPLEQNCIELEKSTERMKLVLIKILLNMCIILITILLPYLNKIKLLF